MGTMQMKRGVMPETGRSRCQWTTLVACTVLCAAYVLFLAPVLLQAGSRDIQGPDAGRVFAVSHMAPSGEGEDGSAAKGSDPSPSTGREDQIVWVLYGLLLAFVFYNFIIFLSTRDSNYLYCSLALLGLALYLSTSGVESGRFFGSGGAWQAAPFFFSSMASASYLMFSRSFLNTKSISTSLDRALLGAATLFLLLMPLALIPGFNAARNAANTLPIITMPLLAWAGYASMGRRRRQVLFLLSSLGVLIMGITLQAGARSGMLPDAFVISRSGLLGAACLAVLLSLGLEDRINSLRKSLLQSRKELWEANHRLDEERELVDVALRCVAEGVIVTDPEGRVFLMNSLAGEITGYPGEQAAGKHIQEVLNPVSLSSKEPDIIRKVFRLKGDIDISHDDLLILREDGALRNISCRCSPLRSRNREIMGVIMAFSDVTRQRKYEEEMVRASTLDALSTLAGGIAHDFNNILTAIVGNVSLAKLRSRDNGLIAGILADIETASYRAKDLTQQLLTFSKGGAPVKEVSNIGSLLKEVVGFHLIGSSVKVEMDIEEDLWNASIDQGQMSHVIGNIVINAKQAMPEGGHLWVTAINFCIGPGEEACVPAGDYLRISIRDEGCGIPDESLGKIFDPFYTTKPEGSGLGLASSITVVRNHDGDIEVESSPGEGAEFIIYLPATEEEAKAMPAQDSVVIRGSGKILIMDDEYIILKSIGGLIRALGYEVVCVRNGYEAIKAYRQAMSAGMAFDLVIADLVVPGSLGGKDMVQKLLETDPEARVIATSGYPNDPVMLNCTSYGFMDTIVKPFTVRTLSQVISGSLDVR
jgi:PAS domain S-box-containing protein